MFFLERLLQICPKIDSHLHRFQKNCVSSYNCKMNLNLTNLADDKLLTDYKHNSHRMQKTARQATSGLLIHEFLIL